MARALAALPALTAALGEGRLCYEQVRALVRVATPSAEAELIEQAAGMTATQVEAMVRGLRAVSAEEAAEANLRRSLRLRWVREDGTLRRYGRLPDVDGVAIATAIERIAAGSPVPAVGCAAEPWSARAADALVELASCSLARDAEPAPAQVVAHVEAEALAAAEEGAAMLECGVAVAAETVRRLACDADLLAVVRSAGKRPVGVGRRRRSVPRSLMRLRHRDGGCRFPGCTRTRGFRLTIVTIWADGGPTDLDNLVLCAFVWRPPPLRPRGRLAGRGGPGRRPPLRPPRRAAAESRAGPAAARCRPALRDQAVAAALDRVAGARPPGRACPGPRLTPMPPLRR